MSDEKYKEGPLSFIVKLVMIVIGIFTILGGMVTAASADDFFTKLLFTVGAIIGLSITLLCGYDLSNALIDKLTGRNKDIDDQGNEQDTVTAKKRDKLRSTFWAILAASIITFILIGIFGAIIVGLF